MSGLSLFLPAFAADYSGACSTLFDLDALVVLNDAACCTRNYVDYDEPRWSRTKTTTLCAQLRTMDVVMGDEERTIAKVADAAQEAGVGLVALLGSPVPAITGMDLRGMASEVEARTGIPSLGLETTGFRTYERGIDLALRGLLGRFCASRPRGEGADPGAAPGGRLPINVLGVTPLDFGAAGNDRALAQALDGEGFDIVSSWGMGCSLESLARAPHAAANLVASIGALPAAKEMQRRWGVPYVVGVPCAGPQRSLVARSLREAAETGVSRCAFQGGAGAAAADGRSAAAAGGRGGAAAERLLIVGDWVVASSVRSACRLAGWEGDIAVASLFGASPSFAEPGDAALSGDAELAEFTREGSFSLVAGDPLLARVPAVEGARLARMAHPAVSSNLHADEVPRYFEDDPARLVLDGASRRNGRDGKGGHA